MMKGAVKRILIGMAVIFGMHLALGVLVTRYAESVEKVQTEPLGASLQVGNPLFLAIILGSFFIGGLIVGFMEERVVLSEPIVAAVLAMALVSGSVLWWGLGDTLFLVSYARAGDWGSFLVTGAIGAVTTLGGSLIGERMRTPAEETPVVLASVVIGLGLVIVGPFLLLLPYGLPWYIAVIAILTVLVLVGVAYFLFVQGRTFEQEVSEISIHPERQRPS